MKNLLFKQTLIAISLALSLTSYASANSLVSSTNNANNAEQSQANRMVSAEVSEQRQKKGDVFGGVSSSSGNCVKNSKSNTFNTFGDPLSDDNNNFHKFLQDYDNNNKNFKITILEPTNDPFKFTLFGFKVYGQTLPMPPTTATPSAQPKPTSIDDCADDK